MGHSYGLAFAICVMQEWCYATKSEMSVPRTPVNPFRYGREAEVLVDRAQASAKKFFLSLKPSLSIDTADGKITVEVGVSAAVRAAGIPMLTEFARRRGLPRTTMVRALEVLEAPHFLRQGLSGPSVRWHPDDPFLRAWLGTLETL